MPVILQVEVAPHVAIGRVPPSLWWLYIDPFGKLNEILVLATIPPPVTVAKVAKVIVAAEAAWKETVLADAVPPTVNELREIVGHAVIVMAADGLIVISLPAGGPPAGAVGVH